MKISKEKAFSVMESLLFISSDPRPFSDFETLFKGEIDSCQLKELMSEFQSTYNKKDRGLYLEKAAKGWQLRTKTENKEWLLKIKPPGAFRLSRPSLEALSIIAYEQPCSKMEIDQIRGVESGHLLRTLMEKGLIRLSGKSPLPGKASLYKTTKKFLEVFSLESLSDLPSKEEIEELLTDIKKENKESLPSLSKEFFSTKLNIPYQEDEKENKKIKDSLKSLPLSVDFSHQDKKNRDKQAQDKPDQDK